MTAKIKVIGPHDKDPLPDNATLVYVVSRASDWSRDLSPFFGPVQLWRQLVIWQKPLMESG